MLLAIPSGGAAAQEVARPSPPPGSADAASADIVDFSADTVTYDNEADVVQATGEVRMNRDGNYLAADEVVWDRKSGQVVARGNVVLVTPEGDKLVGDTVQLTDTLRDGVVDNLLVVLDNGARIAATRGTRVDGVTTFVNAIYTPCPVTKPSGCPKRPSWSITAARVIDDPKTNRVRFEGGRLQLFGVNIPLLPIFNVGRGNEGATGFLVPDFSLSSRNGFEIAVPYHWQLAPNRDFTVTPHAYTGVLPALSAEYRDLSSLGAFQLGGFITYGKVDRVDPTATGPQRRGIRGYFAGNGKWQLDPEWSVTASVRAASDKTATRRYDLTSDDRLRSVINVERITPDNYISIAGWAFQGLRVDDRQKQMPIALP
ncbi:MAG: LPS assembly protein LptD, partial [Pseudomonadota bacterium]